MMAQPQDASALTPWQARQAAMLDHFASLDDLKQVSQLTIDLIHGTIGPLVALAGARGDKPAAPPLFAWQSVGCSSLTTLRMRLYADILRRGYGFYKPTAASDFLCGRTSSTRPTRDISIRSASKRRSACCAGTPRPSMRPSATACADLTMPKDCSDD